jgi:hypothetical protein
MGVWDVDAFGNDSACDWAAQFAETGTLELLTEELEDAASTRGYYRDEALVACEVVARLQGRWGQAECLQREDRRMGSATFGAAIRRAHQYSDQSDRQYPGTGFRQRACLDAQALRRGMARQRDGLAPTGCRIIRRLFPAMTPPGGQMTNRMYVLLESIDMLLDAGLLRNV